MNNNEIEDGLDLENFNYQKALEVPNLKAINLTEDEFNLHFWDIVGVYRSYLNNLKEPNDSGYIYELNRNEYNHLCLVVIKKESKVDKVKKNYILNTIKNMDYDISLTDDSQIFSKKSEILDNDLLVERNKLINFFLEEARKNKKQSANKEDNITTNDQQLKSAFIYGDFGVGKSIITQAYTNTISLKYNLKIAYITLNELFKNVIQFFNYKDISDSVVSELINELSNIDVLVIDDFSSGNLNYWSISTILMPIIENRLKSMKQTIFISNFSIEQLNNSTKNIANIEEQKAKLRLFNRIECLTYGNVFKIKGPSIFKVTNNL